MTSPLNVKTTYNAHQNLFAVRWQAELSLPTLQDEYEALLAEATSRRAVRWLLDVRQRPTPSIEAANWVTLNWLPRAAALVAPTRLSVAYVISSQRAEALALDPELVANVNDVMAPNRHYQLALFGTEDEALGWLLA